MNNVTHYSREDIVKFIELFSNNLDSITGMDTETTGLDIGEDRPFLFQFGFSPNENECHIIVLDIEKDRESIVFIKRLLNYASLTKCLIGANVKFDLNMLLNLDSTIEYNYNNITDIQFYIRAAHDHVSRRFGGVSLGLKDYAAKYINPDAKSYDKELQQARGRMAKTLNNRLKELSGKPIKYWKELLKDHQRLEMSEEDYQPYRLWCDEIDQMFDHNCELLSSKDIPYNVIDRELVIKYGYYDVELLFDIYYKTLPTIQDRGTYNSIELENKLIIPALMMERKGFEIDRDYVNHSSFRMRSVIKEDRQELKDLTGEDITCNQHKRIKEWLTNRGLEVTGTDDNTLSKIKSATDDELVQNVIDVTQRLRTLEKWYTTYLKRFLGRDKIYTQINLVGAASLRMSSDFQQFPKGAIFSSEGEELFNPRKAIKISKGYMVYLDYSQIELRVQAMYTILLDNPDINLCRAYMPYKCYTSEWGQTVTFDHTNKRHVDNIYKIKWYHEEDDSEWSPLDVHGATTKKAFNIDEDHEDYKELRAIGKRVNFAKNYGAQYGCIADMFPDYPEDMIHKIDNAYYEAFPGIKTYQEYCYRIANEQPYATNLFGMRYWGVPGHTLINTLIQGSSAIKLKHAILDCYNYLKDNNVKGIDMVMPVHDEIQFHVTKAEDMHHILELKKIMEKWDDAPVPMVADIEVSKGAWSDKKAYSVEEFKDKFVNSVTKFHKVLEEVLFAN